MLSLVLLLVAGLLRSTAAAALLRLRPAGTAARLPWLLRCTGAEALALFSIGFKVRLGRVNRCCEAGFCPCSVAGRRTVRGPSDHRRAAAHCTRLGSSLHLQHAALLCTRSGAGPS